MNRPVVIARLRRYRPGRRLAAITLLSAVVASAAFADRLVFRSDSDGQAASSAALSRGSTLAWFCPLVPALRSQPGNGTIVVANLGDKALSGSVAITAPGQLEASIAFTLDPKHKSVLRPGDVINAPLSAATVRLDGVGAIVEHTATSKSGTAVAPCTPEASAEWYLGEGSTASNSTNEIAIFNPFAEDAIVDMNFLTSEGRSSPQDLQGVVVSGRQLHVINIGDTLKRRDWIVASIKTRSGRIVVEQRQTNSSTGLPGVSLALGAPSALEHWYVPHGSVTPGYTDQLSIFNPNDEEVVVQVRFISADDQAPPFTLHVPAEGRTTARFGVDRVVPKENEYALVVDSTDGKPVVATQTSTAGGSADTDGVTVALAAELPARSWGLAAGATSLGEQRLWLVNMSENNTSVRVTPIGDGPSVLNPVVVDLEPGERRALLLNDSGVTNIVDAGVLIESDEPILASRSVVMKDRKGLWQGPAIPLR